jgi:hydrogenase maturation protein HypF
MSKDTGIRTVALSGGVWQNITLMRRTLSLLHAGGFQVYLHHQVLPMTAAFRLVKL